MLTKFSELRFDNANNSALSLRMLAELVRSGDVLVKEPAVGDASLLYEQSLSLFLIEPKKSGRRPIRG